MLAGNVTASIQDGNLIITGDEGANVISIESAPGAGNVAIRGFNSHVVNWGTTSVNGVRNGLTILSGFNGSVFVRMGGGSDTVRVSNLVVPGDVYVDGGAGDDLLIAGRDIGDQQPRFENNPNGPLYVEGRSTFNGGTGNDRVYHVDTHMTGDAAVNLDGGHDMFYSLPFSSTPGDPATLKWNEYFNSLRVVAGAGNDTVHFQLPVIKQDLFLDDTSGISNISLNLAHIGGSLRAFTGDQADWLNLTDVAVGRDAQIETRGGNDNVIVYTSPPTQWGYPWYVDHTDIRALTVKTGAGNDYVSLRDSDVDQLYAFLGEGNDGIDLVMSNIEAAWVYGGGGDDTLNRVRRTGQTDPVGRLGRSNIEHYHQGEW